MKQISNPYLAALLISLTAQAAATERLMDPTRPASVSANLASEQASVIRLEAIFSSGDRLVAIVNGNVVRTGDRIAGIRIDAINSNSVRYTRAGRSETMQMQNRAMRVRHNVTTQEDDQ
jgi:hypothetical protein